MHDGVVTLDLFVEADGEALQNCVDIPGSTKNIGELLSARNFPPIQANLACKFQDSCTPGSKVDAVEKYRGVSCGVADGAICRRCGDTEGQLQWSKQKNKQKVNIIGIK